MRTPQTESEELAQKRKEELEKYFHKTPPQYRNVLILLGLAASAIVVVIALAVIANGSGFLGLVFLAAGGYGVVKGVPAKLTYNKRYRAAEPKPTDEEMDRTLAADLANIEERAMARLGLTFDDLELVRDRFDPIANLERGNPYLSRGERRPLLVFGPQPPFVAALGSDGVWRFSSYQVMVICPTSYHLAMYRCTINFSTGGLHQEETQEYPYAHVVAVSTMSVPGGEFPPEPVDGREDDKKLRFAKTTLREFQVVVAAGDRSRIVVGITDDDDPEREALLQQSGIDEVITAVRRMLREKSGTMPPPGRGTS